MIISSVPRSMRPASSIHASTFHYRCFPRLSGLAVLVVLLLAGEVDAAFADTKHSKDFATLLGGGVHQLLKQNQLQLRGSDKKDVHAGDSSLKVPSRKVQSGLGTTSNGETNRNLMNNPVNLVNGVLHEEQEMCLSLTDVEQAPVRLQVCDGSDEQKWYYDPDSDSTSGPIKSYFDDNLCLDGGNNSSDLTFLMSSVCDGTSSSQSWLKVGDGILNGLYGKLISAGNGCEGVESGDTAALLENDLATSFAEWNQLGADIDGESAGDRSGTVSLSADGSIVAIGAWYNDGSGTDAGHVRVFQFSNTTLSWDQLGADIDGESAGDVSGDVSLSADGSIVAIGAPNNDGGGADAGHVRVFHFNNTTLSWDQLGADIDGESAGDWSDQWLSLSGDGTRVAIGATGDDNGAGTNAGSVRVFQFNDATMSWDQLGADIDGERDYSYSGTGVSLSADGTTVAIAAPYNNDGGVDAGSVRVFKFNDLVSSWDQLGADIDGEGEFDRSGDWLSLSADGTIVAIGAYYNDDGGVDAGHVRVFQFNNTTLSWDQLGADIDGESAGDVSGSVSLSADGSIVAIGAQFNAGGGADAGHLRVFHFNDATLSWDQLGPDIDGESAVDRSGWFVSLSADGTIVAIGALYNDNGSGIDAGHVRVFTSQSCTEHQKWNIRTTSASSGLLNVTISRTGPITISDGTTPTQKDIGINYSTSTNGGETITNATIFEKDCVTPANTTLPVSSFMEGDNLLKVNINYDATTVESNPNIWEGRTNDAGVEIGGDFRLCLRVNMFHVDTNHEINFKDTNLTGSVDKTEGADFNLVVGVDRDDATDEDVNNVDFDASVVGFQCEVSTFTPNNDPVSQGSTLGLCVRSNTTGIKVAGWDSLSLQRGGIEFNAITNGIATDGLVVPSCVDDQCTSQVQLISDFFDSDGELSVDGMVILAVNDTRRHLVEVKRDIALISDESFGRVLDEDINRGGFKIGINVISSVSASATLYPGSFYPLMVGFMVLRFLVG